ncbi:MAG: hypothetical protein P9M03_06765, partial [Candidatus Theseobacter exili]|nr:hypothetical protein [Candidatus Theseobacter exili]
MNMLFKKIFLFSACFFFFTTIQADTVLLKNGKTIKGKILTQTGKTIDIRQAEGIVHLDPARVRSVEYGSIKQDLHFEARKLYVQRRMQLATNDVEGHFNLGAFCMNNGLYEEAISQFKNLAVMVPHQLDDVQNLINQAEEAAANNIFTRAQWWHKFGNNPEMA